MKSASRFLLAALAASVAVPVHAAAPAPTAAPVAEPELLDIKPDVKTGKIIATFPKPAEDGVALAAATPDGDWEAI